MRVAITGRFENSYFSGAITQVAISLSRAFVSAGHTVELLAPPGEKLWFIDCKEHEANITSRKHYALSDISSPYDLLLEVVWSIPAEDRPKVAAKTIYFAHYPPLFHDMESSVYQCNNTKRDFKNLHGIWTWDHYNKDDTRYLEFLSGLKVFTIPFVWDSDPLDLYVKETNLSEWAESAKQIESKVPSTAPASMSWCLRMVESNMSNSSSSILPLTIVSAIRAKGDEVRWVMHNGEGILQSQFFQSNVVKNCNLGTDISGNFVGRLRLPDMRRDKTVLICHQRWRPLKATLLDALYLGIPMIHNCTIAKSMGGSYYYELNQIQDAQEAWIRLKTDAETGKGFFHPTAIQVRKRLLNDRFGPSGKNVQEGIQTAIKSLETTSIVKKVVSTSSSVLKIAFVDMWENFQPEYNFFYHLFEWAGKTHGFTVEVTKIDPSIVLYGPFGTDHQKATWSHIPKIFYTGENVPQRTDHKTLLNLGFEYPKQGGTPYIRLPLWMIEINWFKMDPSKFVNPIPMELEECLKPVPSQWNRFCSFVATNPGNPLRNTAFQLINQYKPVEAAGRLFCNRNNGPLPAGAGGGGGERIKTDYYKDSKFVIAFENSSSPGYCTEKIFHAKVAGAIPIYWGDPLVGNDFDEAGFFHAGKCGNGEDLVKQLKALDEDEARCKAMQAIPALSEKKRKECEATMGILVKAVCAIALHRDVTVLESEWILPDPAVVAAAVTVTSTPPTLIVKEIPRKKCFVTAANAKYIDSAKMLLESLRATEKVPMVLYIWSDVPIEKRNMGEDVEVRILPTDLSPWEGFWNPHHFAWKIWVLHDAGTKAEIGTNILYLDAGVFIACPLTKIWNQIQEKQIFLLDDEEQLNERWCHPDCCRILSISPTELKEHQITAGLIGYSVGSRYQSQLIGKALQIVKEFPAAIQGEKWKPYGGVCFGHRHDQSILSILSSRYKAERLPLKDFYCDHSLRRAQSWQTPLYVHRGNFKPFVPIAPGIGEAYVINLDRRPDRLKKFKESHPTLYKNTYKWIATDGKNLTLTPQIAHLFRSNDFKWKKAVMGCAISHLGVWEKCANDHHNYLIMEDDVKFQSDWESKWVAAASQIPADADVIYLGGVLPPNKPALPMITESVNPFFAKVAKNNAMSGGPPRRYFHFCNYSYILTQQGAQKLISLVHQNGIFTSGDHMIVNHGDSLLNIYFTTPLLAGCFQDEDPVYQTSAFNDFSRKDTFDSDLWNNNDHFSPDEIVTAMATFMKPQVVPTVVDSSAVSGRTLVYAIEKTGIGYEKTWLEDMFQTPLQVSAVKKLPHNSILLYQRTPPSFQVDLYKKILDSAEGKVILLHLSDEDGKDPIELYNHSAVKHVIRNYYRKDCVGRPTVFTLPLGYSTQAPSATPTFADRSLVWSFAGSIDRPGREAALLAMEALTPFEKQTKPSFGDPSPLQGSAYTDQLLKTKFIPAVKGFWSLESFRLYEALEAGCIPLYVPAEGSLGDEYTEVLGKSPMLALPSWTQAPQLLQQLSKNPAVMEQHRQDLQTWWIQKKQSLRTILSSILSI
jgi:GR25 family glycosyltransferase involved in LPS biosynthesis